MIVGPKYKICKRLGAAVFEQCQSGRFTLAEARQKTVRGRGGRGGGGRRPRAMSDYKRQLLEKQKVRYLYGLGERQLARYVAEASGHAEGPARALIARLESRLDNVVYRLGLARTRRLARQLVSHGHITAHDKKVTVPSYQVALGEEIAVREGSKDLALFAALREEGAERAPTPTWLEAESDTLSGRLRAVPPYDQGALLFDLEAVLEYYSK